MRTEGKELGAVIKTARQEKGLTQENLAEKAGIGLRHMMAIENEGSYPSYGVLYKLIRELGISADSIFYPDKQAANPRIDDIIRMLPNCDQRSIKIIRAAVKAALEGQTAEL